jgi:hypothetical protein
MMQNISHDILYRYSNIHGEPNGYFLRNPAGLDNELVHLSTSLSKGLTNMMILGRHMICPRNGQQIIEDESLIQRNKK